MSTPVEHVPKSIFDDINTELSTSVTLPKVFTLHAPLSRRGRETLSDIYTTLNEEQIRDVIDQLINILG